MLKILKKLNKKEWSLVALSIIFVVGQVWLDLKIPDYMSKITRLIMTPGNSIKDVWSTGGYMLLFALGSAFLAFIVGFFAAKIAAGLAKRLRGEVFDKVQNFSVNEIKKFSTPSLITRSTNDVGQVQMIVAMGLQVIVKAPILATWAILKILGKSWQWSVATAGTVLFLVVAIVIIISIAMPLIRKIPRLTDNLNKVARENLNGIRVVRAYNAEEYEQEKFEVANEELTSTFYRSNKVMMLMGPVMNISMNVLSLSIYWIGAYLISVSSMVDKLTVFSDMVVFNAYAMQVVMAFIMMTMIFLMYPRVAVSIKRINEVLNTDPSVVDGGGDVVTSIKGEIEFKNVNFRYPDAEECILKDINLKINKGEVVAFIGSTGSGKSTLINLVPRFYDVSKGEVLVDGINVKEYKLKELNNKIGYISQKAVLFSGTIKSNIDFGESNINIQDEDVVKAVKIAQATKFVEATTEGYDSTIAQRGTNVSGGQKQRLSIARAIARAPEIFIFDDSFSALDYKTDKKLRQALKKELKDTTTLIVAQRISTIMNADKIVVLDNGEIVGMGTHKELLSKCKIYQEIAYSQLNKEELGNE